MFTLIRCTELWPTFHISEDALVSWLMCINPVFEDIHCWLSQILTCHWQEYSCMIILLLQQNMNKLDIFQLFLHSLPLRQQANVCHVICAPAASLYQPRLCHWRRSRQVWVYGPGPVGDCGWAPVFINRSSVTEDGNGKCEHTGRCRWVIVAKRCVQKVMT